MQKIPLSFWYINSYSPARLSPGFIISFLTSLVPSLWSLKYKYPQVDGITPLLSPTLCIMSKEHPSIVPSPKWCWIPQVYENGRKNWTFFYSQNQGWFLIGISKSNSSWEYQDQTAKGLGRELVTHKNGTRYKYCARNSHIQIHLIPILTKFNNGQKNDSYNLNNLLDIEVLNGRI